MQNIGIKKSNLFMQKHYCPGFQPKMLLYKLFCSFKIVRDIEDVSQKSKLRAY